MNREAGLTLGVWLLLAAGMACAQLAVDAAAWPPADAGETDWTKAIALRLGVPDEQNGPPDAEGTPRCDLLGPRWVAEADWCRFDKLGECHQQAVRYAVAWQRDGVMLLLVRRGYDARERAVIERAKWLVGVDPPRPLRVMTFDVTRPEASLVALRAELEQTWGPFTTEDAAE